MQNKDISALVRLAQGFDAMISHPLSSLSRVGLSALAQPRLTKGGQPYQMLRNG